MMTDDYQGADESYRVKYDQTEALRIYHASKKVRGKLQRVCPKGCGQYLSDDEVAAHQCSGPPMALLLARAKLPSANASAPAKRIPVIGRDYGYRDVAAFFKPTPILAHFVLANGKQIVALRVREDHNPHIFGKRPQIWVGAIGDVKVWGDRLAGEKEPIPVFVTKLGRNTYTFVGRFSVMPYQATAAELANARNSMTTIHNQSVSRIVFLKKA